MKTAKEVKQAICDAVWLRKIDQMHTREVAEQFDCSLTTARNILTSIYNGTSGDERFKQNTERGESSGVLLHDGSTWGPSPIDANRPGTSGLNTPKHYVWFAS